MKKPFAYRQIIFLQGDEAEEPLGILDTYGVSAAIKYLAGWDYGVGDCDVEHIRGIPPWGSSDRVQRKHNYFLSYNLRLGYIDLCAPVSQNQCLELGILDRVTEERRQRITI